MNSLKTSEMSHVKIVHFDGPKKPLPPKLLTMIENHSNMCAKL